MLFTGSKAMIVAGLIAGQRAVPMCSSIACTNFQAQFSASTEFIKKTRFDHDSQCSTWQSPFAFEVELRTRIIFRSNFDISNTYTRHLSRGPRSKSYLKALLGGLAGID